MTLIDDSRLFIQFSNRAQREFYENPMEEIKNSDQAMFGTQLMTFFNNSRFFSLARLWS